MQIMYKAPLFPSLPNSVSPPQHELLLLHSPASLFLSLSVFTSASEMAENFPFPAYFVLTIITITRLIATVGKTELNGPSLVPSNISHRLRDDPEAIKIASSDYGNLVRESPLAVFQPSSIYDIISLIRSSYTSSVPFPIAARGHGHSTRGQAMAPNGVVVDMSALRRHRLGFGISSVFHDPSVGYYADVGGEQLWIDVLQATLQHGLAPASWTDYLYLTVGGTLSNAGISGQTFRYGPQISNVHEMDVITGMNTTLEREKRKGMQTKLSLSLKI